jgi:hypothetical protein
MKYLGIDVHTKTSVWSLLDHSGEQLGEDKVETTVPALAHLVSELGAKASSLGKRSGRWPCWCTMQ